MTTEEFEILTQGHIRELIETHLHSDPASFAMNQVHNEFPVALVSTQLKYLQKSREKLPRWYQARCIVPPRAYEQCSSEAAAALKPALSGARCLDLTMGLGVDSVHFSRSFTQVTALEPDPVLSRVVAFNLGLMGVSNIQIVHERAEDFLENYEGPAYDLIYADPSRRAAAGKRDASLAGGSPDVLRLLPLLLRHGRQVMLKISPLFDVEEARRLFPGCDLMVISIGGECKELLIRLPGTHQLEIRLSGKDGPRTYTYPPTPPIPPTSLISPIPPLLHEPDAAFYKARCLPQLMTQTYSSSIIYLNHPEGFYFADQVLPDFPGRVFQLKMSLGWHPRAVKKQLKTLGITRANVLQRRFSLSAQAIREALGIKEGGDLFLIATEIEGERHLFLAERVR